jgi:ACS family hexuronate transporter-like MFS transporter
MNWLPTFLVQDRHFKFGMKLGGIVALPFVGLDLGYLVSGLVVLKLAKSKWPTLFVRRLVLIAAATLMGISMISIPYAKTDALVVALLVVSTFGMAAWNSNYLCFVEELSPSKVSAVAGVVGSAGAFGGAIFLWLIGLISEISGSFTLVFLMVAVMIWLASAGLLCTAEPQKLQSFSVQPLQTKS